MGTTFSTDDNNTDTTMPDIEAAATEESDSSSVAEIDSPPPQDKTPKTLRNSTMIKIHVRLRRQTPSNDATASAWTHRDRSIALKVIAHESSYGIIASKSIVGSGGSSYAYGQKYTQCSLLLQIGKLLGVQPAYAPSPYISQIFDKILENWTLQRVGGNHFSCDRVENFLELADQDELVLCVGDYAKDYPATDSNDGGADLLGLIPKTYNIFTVILATSSSGKGDNTNNDVLDSDSEIEDVTDSYVAKKPKAAPEVINLEDSSDEDEEGGNQSESCFWEYDNYGNMKRSKTTNSSGHEEIEIVDSDSDDDSSDVEDVTDQIMAQRKENVQKLIDNAEEIRDSDDEEEYVEDEKVADKKRRKQTPTSKPAAKRRRKTKKKESPIEVLMDDKDIPMCPGANGKKDGDDDKNSGTNNTDGNNPSGKEVDRSIKQRIVKLLNTGFHDESNEHEARNAMKLARRLMERYNLDQAVLMQERGDGSLNDFSTSNDDTDRTALQGGIVRTKIRKRKTGKPLSSFPRWHDYLVQPVCMNFHVEAFKTVARGNKYSVGECSVTFYGIRTNAQLAAYAFKIASERIALMAATYDPPRRGKLPTAKQIAETKTARLSYALGIVNGLERDVKEGLRKEEEKREEKLRKAQRAAQSGEAYHEDGDSDNGEEYGNTCVGSDSEILAGNELDCPDQDKKASSNAVEHLERLEKENTAHLALIDHHKKIATDVLKSKNIKVRSGRKKKSINFNRKAYEKGVIDSKEIDLNQQAIKS